MGFEKWNILSKSICGAAHIRKNSPCEDYSLYMYSDERPGAVLAVSDGHGGAKHVRSAQGAVFACEAAVHVADKYINAVFEKSDINVVRQLAETRIKVDIVKKWQSQVIEHIKKKPLSEDELKALNISKDECAHMLSLKDINGKEPLFSAYGATLLLVVILNDIIICEQLGDGDIVFYYKDKKPFSPIEKDDKLIANETTSLCSVKAPFYFRHSITYLYEKAQTPDLIMVATDGYANSFSSSDGYYEAARDYYNLLRSDGRAFVDENIGSWLTETSENGSGDDITVALAWR